MVDRIYHLDRGYERMEAKLTAVGAKVSASREPGANNEFGATTSSSVGASAPLTLALSKGRIFEETLPLLAAQASGRRGPGDVAQADPADHEPNLRVIIVRATDVPTYVEYGAADFGVAGKDVLIEHGGGGLYQPSI